MSNIISDINNYLISISLSLFQPNVERDEVVKITTEGDVYNQLYQGKLSVLM